MRTGRITTAVLSLTLLLPLAASAQASGRAHGEVTDEDGKPLAGVKVEVIDPGRSNQVVADDETNERGSYSIVVIDATRPFIFRLTKDGYRPYEQEIKIPVSGNETHDFTLSPATVRRRPAPAPAQQGQAPAPPAEGEIEMSLEAAEAYNAGVKAIKAGDSATAKTKLEEALAIEPNIAPAWAVLGAISLEEGDFAKAVEHADKALAIEPRNALALEAKYKAHAALGQTEEAEAARSLYAEVSPEAGAQLLLDEGIAAFNAGDMEGAIASLEQALAANPDLYQAHYTLGMAFANKQDNPQAVEHLEAFLAAAPADDPNLSLAQEMLDYIEGSS